VRLPRLYMQCAKIIHDVSTGLWASGCIILPFHV
jgi:hypothetical protein